MKSTGDDALVGGTTRRPEITQDGSRGGSSAPISRPRPRGRRHRPGSRRRRRRSIARSWNASWARIATHASSSIARLRTTSIAFASGTRSSRCCGLRSAQAWRSSPNMRAGTCFKPNGFGTCRSSRRPDASGQQPSILGKDPPNLFRVAGLRQRQHQQDARFLRVQRVARDDAERVVFGGGDHPPVADAARSHERRL